MELNTTSMQLFDWQKYANNTFLIDNTKQYLAWLVWHLEQGTFPCDDYSELN